MASVQAIEKASIHASVLSPCANSRTTQPVPDSGRIMAGSLRNKSWLVMACQLPLSAAIPLLPANCCLHAAPLWCSIWLYWHCWQVGPQASWGRLHFFCICFCFAIVVLRPPLHWACALTVAGLAMWLQAAPLPACCCASAHACLHAASCDVWLAI